MKSDTYKAVISGFTHSAISIGADTNILADKLAQEIKEKAIVPSAGSPEHLGLFLGTTYSNLYMRKSNFAKYVEKGLRVMNPADAPKGLISYIGGQLSIILNIRGMQSTLSSFHSQGFDALAQGLYFLGHDRKNKAIIVELIEEPCGDFKSEARGCVILALENADTAPNSKRCNGVLALRSFYEPKGAYAGLKKAIEKCLRQCALDVGDIDSFFLSSSPNDSEGKLQRQALRELSSAVSERKVMDNCLGPVSAGLLPLIDFLRREPGDNTAQKAASMFINRGEDSNSSCLVMSR